MPIKYDDADSYQFHEKDSPDKCFSCAKKSEKMLVLRQIESMKLVHLCQECICEYISDYLLDNTRPWLGEKGNL